MTLDQLPIQKKAKIKAILGQEEIRIRLLEMGLVPNTIIYIQKVAPMKDPIEIVVRDYVLTIRKEIANNILVEVL